LEWTFFLGSRANPPLGFFLWLYSIAEVASTKTGTEHKHHTPWILWHFVTMLGSQLAKCRRQFTHRGCEVKSKV
jgi:hypothetical protein